MSSTLSNEIAMQLTAALRENSRELALKRAVERATLPQWWTDRALRQRYGEIDGVQLRALLEKHRAVMKPRGRGFVVHVDDVLRVDEALKQDRYSKPREVA